MQRTAPCHTCRLSESGPAESRNPHAGTPRRVSTIARQRGARRALSVILAGLACFSLSRPAAGDFPAFPICTAPGEQSRPAICGTTVVWRDESEAIYGRDLAGGAEFFVCPALSPECGPRISGQTVVWVDYHVPMTACRYDLPAGPALPVTGGAADPTGGAAIWGQTVVWPDDRNWPGGGRDIYGIDLSGGGEFAITTAPGLQDAPAVYGSTVVWLGSATNSYDTDIFGKDLVTGDDLVICTAAGRQSSPAIWGDWVVWQDERAGNADIYAYNLVTKTEKPLCTHPSWQTYPTICGDMIVWMDWRNGTSDIIGYNLVADEEVPIHLGPGNQEFPAVSYDPVYGHVVVWEDDGDIYATLPEPATLALVGAGMLVAACRTSRGRRARGSTIGARI